MSFSVKVSIPCIIPFIFLFCILVTSCCRLSISLCLSGFCWIQACEKPVKRHVINICRMCTALYCIHTCNSPSQEYYRLVLFTYLSYVLHYESCVVIVLLQCDQNCHRWLFYLSVILLNDVQQQASYQLHYKKYFSKSQLKTTTIWDRILAG